MSKQPSKQLKKHQDESKRFCSSINTLPTLNDSLFFKDYQYEMIIVMHYLLGEGLAKPTGNYDKKHREIPLFNHNNNTESVVTSITRKPGVNLLIEDPILLSDPESIEKLMFWIITKYKEVKQLAHETYSDVKNTGENETLNTEQHLIHIIAGAAHSICKPCYKQFSHEDESIDEVKGKSDFISKMTRNEKLLFIASLFILSVGMIVFYYSYSKVVHLTLFFLLVFFSLISMTSLIIIKTKFKIISVSKKTIKPSPKRMAYGVSTILLSLTLAGYQLFLLSMVAPNDRNEVPYAVFISTLLTFMIFILCGYLSFYQITYALTKLERHKNSHYYFSVLRRYQKNILPIIDITLLLFFSSITLLTLANFSSLWKAYLGLQ